MNKIFLILLLHFYSFTLFTQNNEYAREIVDTLTSEYFRGRGVVNGGERKAADFIKKEYKKHGLKAFNDKYFQFFSYSINSFPGTVEVSFGNTKLVAGKDFLVGAKSGKMYGSFEIVWYNKDNVPSKKQLNKLVKINFFINKFIIVDDKDAVEGKEVLEQLKQNLFGASGIILLEDDKLTKDLATTFNDFAILTIKRESISRDYKTITVSIDQKFVRDYESQNVIGYVKGEEFSDSIIILSAHYDHLGMMGNQVYFPGANDNASGIAMLLNLAYHYTHKDPPKKTIVFIAFGAEEAGLIGSNYFVRNPTISLNKVNFVMNMDIMGTGDEGAMIVNGTILPQHFEMLQKINTERDYLTQIKARGKAANSDHYWFTEKGIPAFFIYLMGGIKAYHDVYDISTTLPLTEFEDTFRLIRDFIDEL